MDKPKWKPTREQMKVYYQREKMKPEFKERRRKYRMEQYRYRKSLGLCTISGCSEDLQHGASMCQRHLDIQYERNRMNKARDKQKRLSLGICAISGADTSKPTTTQASAHFGFG